MADRSKHPDKHIEAALKYAEGKKWRVIKGGKSAHAWGRLYCPHENPDCRCGEFCKISIASTPRSGENHANMIIRRVDGCIGAAMDGGDDGE